MIQLELDVNKTVIKRKHDTVLINSFEKKKISVNRISIQIYLILKRFTISYIWYILKSGINDLWHTQFSGDTDRKHTQL